MERFSFPAEPVCKNIVLEQAEIRVSLITPRLLRIEAGAFTDLPTQTVWNRDLGDVPHRLEVQGIIATVKTEKAAFQVDIRKGRLLSATLEDGTTVTDFRKGNLRGTARTLDTVNGACRLQPGILSRSGVTVMDDSKRLLLRADGTIAPRPRCRDLYCFAYGHDYLGQLRDFFRLTGPVPLIPKFALGNWWSRYKAYTQEEYRSLMEAFIRRRIPLTVATIDMDWHWVDVRERFGEAAVRPHPDCPKALHQHFHDAPGWTGYSWNTELFPDHRQLLDWLHSQGFRVPLNVHPSQGIRPFEDCYKAVCARMGLDAAKQEPIPFDVTNRAFLAAYFDEVHRPMEDEGVDFWWLDWQQGTHTKLPGLDPLWALNHYHTLHSGRNGKRPLILSRYAGLGSHRYPLGFSGDTICTWKSLAFQPYFTATASNAGYTWWSHDIGGHMMGIQDDQLYLRWLQFGVFSPINRLHSSNSDFMGKEPWTRSCAVSRIAEDFLRLRHKLIPFLYSANYLTHKEGIPLCMPMYYRYDREEAYQAKNQYIFANQLLVCPITEPADKRLNLASTRVWLPEGVWTDIFTGQRYRGGQWVTMFRDLDSFPVLAPQGAMVPMYENGETNSLSLSQPMELHIWQGKGRYELFEDDGEAADAEPVVTVFDLETAESALTLRIQPPTDPKGLLPEAREMTLRFRDVASASVFVNGEPADSDGTSLGLKLGRESVVIRLENVRRTQNLPLAIAKTDLMTRVQWPNLRKSRRFREGKMPRFLREALQELEALYHE